VVPENAVDPIHRRLVVTSTVGTAITTSTASTTFTTSTSIGSRRPLASSIHNVENVTDDNPSSSSFFANDVNFADMGIVSNVLQQRLAQVLGNNARPTLVQHQAYAALRSSTNNVTIGAETGSGKVS
jgi:hypothetical protein